MIELATDMDAFEALVFSQKPASEPWTPVTPYDLESRRSIEGQHPKLIAEVFDVFSILDVGCGRTHVLIELLEEIDPRRHICGMDLFEETPENERWYTQGDIASDSLAVFLRNNGESMEGHELVICREVLEHLTLLQVRQAIRNLCRLSDRYVYVTTRFSSEHDILRVETSDDLDPTHQTIASKDLYRLLFTLEGFRRRADLEAKMDHQGKNRTLVYERVA